VKVAAASDETDVLLMDGVLKNAGIQSLIQRAAGFDAPDFLAGGPSPPRTALMLAPSVSTRTRPKLPECVVRLRTAYQRNGAVPTGGTEPRLQLKLVARGCASSTASSTTSENTLSRDCPKRGTSYTLSVYLGGIRRPKWVEKCR
jgi:hypothetical protein